MRRAIVVCSLAVLGLSLAAAPAGAQILFGHSFGIWAMNDDGSGQHELIPSFSIPGITTIDEPGVSPNGTTMAFEGEWAGANAEENKWRPPAPGACGANCEGIYTLSNGTITRLTSAPFGCLLDPCGGFQDTPTVAPDGDVLFTDTLFSDLPGCSSWCINEPVARFQHQGSAGGPQTEITTPCSNSGDAFSSPEQIAINPVNTSQIAYSGCRDGSNDVVKLAGRDGSTPTSYLFDDAQATSVAFSPDGQHLITSEGGADAGLWRYTLGQVPAPSNEVLAQPMSTTFGSAVEIAGGRILFTAAKDLYTVPTSCTPGTCTFPGSATRLTNLGDIFHAAWTAQTVAAPASPASPPGSTTTGTGPAPPPPGPTIAPAVSKAKLSASSFKPAKSGGGVRLTYTDSQAATMTFVINRANKGRRKGSKCVKPTRKLRHARSCTYYSKVGSFTHQDVAGANTVTFSGRVNGKPLKAGTYQLVGTPHNSAGKAGKPVTITFRVK